MPKCASRDGTVLRAGFFALAPAAAEPASAGHTVTAGGPAFNIVPAVLALKRGPTAHPGAG
jgi:hypothetical protein